MTAPPAPPERLGRLTDGFLTTQLLHVAARLGIADVLSEGAKDAEAIADAVGADPGTLERLLRGLVVDEVLALQEDGRFALTEVGACLCEGVPGSLRGATIVRGDLYYRAAAGLLESVRAGTTPFEQVYGERFFDHLGCEPDREAEFQASMAGRAEQEAGDVVDGYDFGGICRLVDVGGGGGVLLAAILRATAQLRAVLVDRPAAVAEARERLEGAGLAERSECVSGDFFVSVPAGADAYLLSRVIHDWDDADASRILAACRAAMTAESRLLIVEAILPERPHEGPAAVRMDLHMLILLGARERTEAQYRRLLADAGFEVARICPTRSPVGLSVIEAAPVRSGSR